ncbi:MAG: sensor histidine kinase [Planctomycetota bacterium]|jgi:two-component system NtrC family sensor kinase
MPRLGLLMKTALLIVLLFAGSTLAVHGIYLPPQEAEVRAQLGEVAEDCLAESKSLMNARAVHLREKNRRELLDLPFELTADDPTKTRALVESHAATFGKRAARNAELLTREFRDRMGARIQSRAESLASEFRGDAVTGLSVLLGVVLVLSGIALAVAVLLPLGRLLRVTERVAGGDLDAAAGIRSRDEVGRLGRAFDRMTESLRGSRDEIEALNRSLADKVREKTRELEERNAELTATIAELERTRDALVHSKTMATIGTLAGGVAHEFNNLLGGIIGCAEDARTEEDPAAVGESLEMIHRTARRACNITENLLRFSRPPEREPRDTDLAGLVREALDLVRPEAQKRGIEAQLDLREIAAVRIDPGQIHQVVLNLLTNALHAMPEGGELSVSVGREGDEAVIVVEDGGVGIPEDHQARIFEPFFTTREARGEDRGTGLGLSVSYSIVKSHGGTIEVLSRPGEGSVFTVRLPAGGKEE